MFNDLNGPGWRRRMVQSQAIVALFSVALGFMALYGTMHPSSKFLHFMYPRYLVFLGVFVVGQTLMIGLRARKLRDRRLVQQVIGRSFPRNPLPPPPTLSQPSGPQASSTPNPSSY
jgi:hypothetical protein